LKPPAHNFQLEPLRSRLAVRTFVCSSLARQLKTANFIEKPAMTLRWEETLKDCYVLQLLVDLLERQKREGRAGSAATSQGISMQMAPSESEA
jgi:hypothetical protein